MVDLKAIRTERGWTQMDICEEVGISESAYSLFENHKRTPRPHIAIALGKAMGFDWRRFYEDDEEEDSE